jgi:NitT/TauT family transport system ATP-binding protein
MIHLRNFSFGYRDNLIFDSLNLDFDAEITTLVAKNGHGKSTILNQINHEFINHRRGKSTGIYFDSNIRLRYITQNPDNSLLPWYTSVKNLETFSRFQKVTVDMQSFNRDIASFGIDPNQLVHTFSGGQKQLVNLLISLYLQPDVLLLDEPFGALDLHNSLVIKQRFVDWQQSHRAVVVMVSHSLSDILELSQKVLILAHKPSQIVMTLRGDEVSRNGQSIIYNVLK